MTASNPYPSAPAVETSRGRLGGVLLLVGGLAASDDGAAVAQQGDR